MLGYKLVGDITVSSAQTSVSFTGLNVTKDDDYLLVADVVNTAASTSNILVTANGNTTNTNYYYQVLQADGASVSGGRGNLPYVGGLSSGTRGFLSILIKLTNSGYFCVQSNHARAYGIATPVIEKICSSSVFTSVSVTSLTITGSITNSLGVGSRFRLYKLTAKKVADITVGAATTQIDITGLAIDKTSEYMLVSDLVNASGSTSVLSLYSNNNTAAPNYYRQSLYAVNTAVSSARSNESTLMACINSAKAFSIAKLKLANSGYFIYQSEYIVSYGGSALELTSAYTASTFTATSITSLSIKASVTNGIGVGSRFQLYKLI